MCIALFYIYDNYVLWSTVWIFLDLKFMEYWFYFVLLFSPYLINI